MVKVKICGITNLEDALDAVGAGCDALGFVFYKKSPRYISVEKAREIIKQIPASVKKIGVFVNAGEERIKRVAAELRLDILQFHGNETPEFCRRFKGYKIIKAFRLKDKRSLKDVEKYSVWACLFDSYQTGVFGGTGKKFNWQILEDMLPSCRNIFLSGGLNARNVGRAVKLVSPDWVDASSSLEKSPGKKDEKKVREFIKAAKKDNKRP